MKSHCLALALFFIWSIALQAQDTPEEGAIIDTIDIMVDLFNELDPMDITLTVDLKNYQRNKYKKEYVPAHMLCQINDSHH